MDKPLSLVAVLMFGILLLLGCGEKQDSKSQLNSQKAEIVSQLNNLLSEFPDEQKDFLIYGKSASSDDKSSAWLNLTNEGKLDKYTKLKEKLEKIEDKME